MPTALSHPPPSALRRRLAALRPGRPTAIACAVAMALAAAGLELPQPDADAAAGDTARAEQPTALVGPHADRGHLTR